jgi:hypothetical protein
VVVVVLVRSVTVAESNKVVAVLTYWVEIPLVTRTRLVETEVEVEVIVAVLEIVLVAVLVTTDVPGYSNEVSEDT